MVDTVDYIVAYVNEDFKLLDCACAINAYTRDEHYKKYQDKKPGTSFLTTAGPLPHKGMFLCI